ncbi:succinylglutamate desuccinylase/aspartoacylase family protein [Plebeiibacterium marinum]|uniref:Succinylglutamate desuccinylase/aspartoacylase family protein n=1 Tax=Plebeiibacterium marinum TaxID=2992111 RepID=A0AAE3MH50_9BACT|nr:succinylglutamate desuccinylase/aspartoacylase family protein [Plebeiobacterium marinum]MCW3807494.1 succinylglutamate desuccinylase/aspartoacylase family protein [Plebeiobacterium marinum]
MRKEFKINNELIKAGESKVVYFSLPALHSNSTITMPVHIVHGKKEGPVLFISAAIHGDEINGVEIIRRLLSMDTMKRMRGTLLAVPVVNIYGFNSHSRYLPDRRDLNRSFPGVGSGSMAGRLANIFLTEVVSRSDIGIDIHTASIHRDNLPQVRADLNDDKLNIMSKVFESPVILHSAPPLGSLRAAANQINVPVMVYESGEALRFDELSIRVGVRGILNVMNNLGMLTKSTQRKQKSSVILHSSTWVRASTSGILRATVSLGDMVKKGDLIGYISNPASKTDTIVEATSSGIIIGRTNIPLIYEGEALFHIGKSHQTKLLEEHMDALNNDSLLNPPELVEEPVIV